MKKNIIYSLSLFLLLSLSACNQWLEVEPKTEIKSDKMFENETGFRDALIGCYMMMADSTLYGRESTVCFFDVLAQQYDMATNNPYNNLKQYRYESYTGTIDGIWQKTYSIIANLNALLEATKKRPSCIPPLTASSKEKPSVCGLSCTLNCCAYSAGEIWRTSLPTWTSFPSLT